MSFQHKFTTSWSSGSESLSGSITATADGEESRDIDVPATTTVEVDLDFVAANLKSFYALSDKALTLKTNSSGSPSNTFALGATVPFTWPGTGTNPFTSDVTKIFLVNAGASAAKVNIRALQDSTP